MIFHLVWSVRTGDWMEKIFSLNFVCKFIHLIGLSVLSVFWLSISLNQPDFCLSPCLAYSSPLRSTPQLTYSLGYIPWCNCNLCVLWGPCHADLLFSCSVCVKMCKEPCFALKLRVFCRWCYSTLCHTLHVILQHSIPLLCADGGLVNNLSATPEPPRFKNVQKKNTLTSQYPIKILPKASELLKSLWDLEMLKKRLLKPPNSLLKSSQQPPS